MNRDIYGSYFSNEPELMMKFKESMSEGGGDEDFVKLVINNPNFTDFKANLQRHIENSDTTKDDIASGYGEDILNISLDDFMEIRNSAISLIESFLNREKEKRENVAPEVRRIPYHKILNGNFTKLNHEAVTEEEKRLYNVQGLIDEMWDVYIDLDENGRFTGGYKTVYYDLGTKNEQFFMFYKYLEKYSKLSKIDFNVKTHLILFDRDLLGVDTMTQLSREYEAKVVMEGRVNPWFHMRECARISKNGVISRFEMTIQNYAFIWLYCQNINTFLSAPRQIGKTYILLQLMAYEYAYGSTDFTALFLHYQYTRCVENKVSCLEIADDFPEFLRIHTVRNRIQKGREIKRVEPSKKNNSKESKNEQLNNILLSVAISPQESEAAKAGRGKTARFVFFDEFNFVKYIIAAMSGVQFAHSTARDMARANGQRYGVHYASTAGTLDTKQGREMYDTIHNKLKRFDNKLFAMSYEELTSYLKTAKMNFFFVEYGYQELGMSESWYDERRRDISDVNTFRCDILMEWLSTGKGSLFTQKYLDRIDKFVNATTWDSFLLDNTHMIDYVVTNPGNSILEELQKVNVLGMGIDIASGGGGDSDSTVFFAYNMETCEPIFEYATNNMLVINFIPFYKRLCDFVWQCNPSTQIISAIEWDGPGKDVIPALRQDKRYAKTVFKSTRFTDKELEDRTTSGWTKEVSGNTVTTWGSVTNRRRFWMTESLLMQLVQLQPYTMNNKFVSAEIKTLTRRGSKNRIEHKSGAHDDRVFARLHGYGMIFDEDYREDLLRHFNYIPDLMKIKMIPMSEHNIALDDIHNKGYINTEGKLEFTLIDKYSPEFEMTYKDLYVTKVINGKKVELDMKAIMAEAEENEELAEALWESTNSKPNNITMLRGGMSRLSQTKKENIIHDDFGGDFVTMRDLWDKKGKNDLSW